MSALDEYRRAQRMLRREFEPLTQRLCPTCADPCCRIPARVTAMDVLVAQAGGWQAAASPESPDPVMVAVEQASLALQSDQDSAAPPCPFLEAHGCAFPADLRPMECTAYICAQMLAAMDAHQRARVRRLTAEVRRAHDRLMSGLRFRKGRHRD